MSFSWADELLPESVSFVGGHPMAGKAISIEGADADLFKGATWCVTPSIRATEAALRNVLGMVAALGAEAFFVDSAEHDAYVAGISHLPFVLAAALTNALGTDSSWKDMKSLTAGGFKDMTRLASGSPVMHRDIVLTNQAAILRWIDQFQGELSAVRDLIARESIEGREAEIEKFFNKARDIRAEWSTQVTREGELLQQTGSELQHGGRRRPDVADVLRQHVQAADGRGRSAWAAGRQPSQGSGQERPIRRQLVACRPGKSARHRAASGHGPCAGSVRTGSRSARSACPAD